MGSFSISRTSRPAARSTKSEFEALAHANDWSSTELGPPDSWPTALRTTLEASLSSPDPLLFLWGKLLRAFPNAAFRPLLGSHGRDLAAGCPAEALPTVFETVRVQAERVLAQGEPARAKDVELTIERDGQAADTYHSLSFTPIRGDDGLPAGVLIRADDVTDRVLAESRMAALRELAERTHTIASPDEACQSIAIALGSSSTDLVFVLIYLSESKGRRPRLLGAFGLPPGTPAAPRALSPEGRQDPWPFARVVSEGRAVLLDSMSDKPGMMHTGRADETVRSAVVLPLGVPGEDWHGILVAGIHPRRPPDRAQRGFLEHAAREASAAIGRAAMKHAQKVRDIESAAQDRVKLSFFNNVSHEFRTPLTLMLGPLTEVIDDPQNTLAPDHLKRLELVRKNALKFHRMVDTLLDLARIDAGRVTPIVEPVDLAHETKRVVDLFRIPIQRAGLELDLAVAPLGEPVFVDREMWEKIVLNLLSNALKYTREGRIRVALTLGSQQATLAVSDTGRGIDARELSQVFERFRKVGNGIGLSLVKALAELHGGTFSVESQAGRGTSAIVSVPRGSAHGYVESLTEPRPRVLVPIELGPYLPALTEGERDAFEGSALGETARIGETSWLRERTATLTVPLKAELDRPRVLIVDENQDMRAHLAQILEPHARVRTTSAVAEAVEIARSDVPNLIIADLGAAADGSARPLVAELRREPRTAAIPCLVLSARAGAQNSALGFDASLDDFLQKPFSGRDLVARVTALAERARLRGELTRREEAARREAEESRRFLATLIGNLPGMAYRGQPDRDRTMEFVSDGIGALTGYPPQSFVEREVCYGRFIHREDQQRVARELERAVEERRPYRLIYRLVNAGHEERWVREQGRPIHRPSGELLALEGLVIDITELKWTEEQLREESRTVRTIHQVGSYLAAELSLEKVVDTVTTAARELIGAELGAFFYRQSGQANGGYGLLTVSGPASDDLASLWRFPATALFQSCLAQRKTIRFDDLTTKEEHVDAAHALASKNGCEVRSCMVTSIISSSGEVMGALLFGHSESGVFSDREEQIVIGLGSQAAIALDNARLYRELELSSERFRQMADKAESANRAKDEFLATLSHEMRTPLNAMLGWAQLLATEKFDAETFSRAVRSIERNTRSMAQLINDLLDVSRIVMGKLRLDMRPVNLIHVINAAVETVRTFADGKGVKLVTVLEPSTGAVSGDASRLQQVVWNLLTNAVKFTPSGGTVELRLEERGASSVISVADTGRGIAPDFLPHIFERFRQADSSSTRSHGGLGLGLAIVRHLVELHGGTIRAESQGDNRGATFTVELPLLPAEFARRAERRATSRIERSAELPTLEGLHVLVVDDEPDAREFLGTLLEQFGADVRAVGSAAEALCALDAEVPDVLVSDVCMPDQDGYSLIRSVRGREPARGGSVPAIAVTAYASGQDRDRALAEGFDRHVPKPIEARDLVIFVARLAAKRASAPHLPLSV